MGRNPQHKYSFSLALILPQILGQQFLQIGIKTKTKQNKPTISSALEWAPVQHPWGSRSLGRLPSSRDYTPSVPKAGRGDRQGAERRQWHPLARQGRQVLGRRHPGPSPKRPVKLEAISEPQVPRGPRGTQDQFPRITGAPQSGERSATACRSEFRGAAPREDSGWGRRGAHGAAGHGAAGGASQPSLPLSIPASSADSFSTYGGGGPRTRRSLAGRGD